MDKLTAWATKITLAETIHHVRTFITMSAAVIALAWSLGGSLIYAQADDAVTEILKSKGMGPDEFKNVQKQLEELRLKVAKDYELQLHVGKQQDILQAQLNDNEKKLDVIEGKTAQTYDLLLKMLPTLKTEVRP